MSTVTVFGPLVSVDSDDPNSGLAGTVPRRIGLIIVVDVVTGTGCGPFRGGPTKTVIPLTGEPSGPICI